jgi:hypothetical protein
MVLRIVKMFMLCAGASLLASCATSHDVAHRPLAPAAQQYQGGVIQVYAARTLGAKKALAVHTWISTKKSGESEYTSYEVIGWRLRYQESALAVRHNQPDKDWWGNAPQLLLDYRQDDADEVIDKIAAAVAAYPYKHEYKVWPGPNSNTFTAYIGKEVSELGLDLPSTAIGKDYRELGDSLGLSPSGTGVQASLFGLLSLTLGIEEGLELNILGLNIELDLFDLAIELPGLGRVGADPVSPSDVKPTAQPIALPSVLPNAQPSTQVGER